MHSHLYNAPNLAACEEVQLSALRGGYKPSFNLLSTLVGVLNFRAWL